MPITVAVDLGKSLCRVAVCSAGERVLYSDAGSPGLVAVDGAASAVRAILPLLAQVETFDILSVGAAGAWAAPDAAAALARRLADDTGARVAVTSDIITAHAGVFSGAPGSLLIAGTGAAALGVDADGVRLVDGWGPELGDLGSGSWIGREGVRAVLRARDGLGADTVLADALDAHIAPHSDVFVWLVSEREIARRLATIAPLVLNAAENGDDAAAKIVAEATQLLAASAAAASALSTKIAIHGGLTGHSWFRTELERALAAVGRTVVRGIGDALDGANLIAHRTDLPHERYVHRAR